MDNQDFEETLRKGREALEQSQKVLAKIAENEKKLEDDPVRKKLGEAVSAILDGIIERNQPQAKATPRAVNRKGPGIAKALRRYCEECKWTRYKLAKETGLDKQLVYDHINKNQGVSLATRQIYRDAFAKHLKVPTSSIDLES